MMMRHVMKSIGALAAFAVLAAGISSVAAHHSGAMFDFSKTQTLKGKVVELRWVNPHVTLTLTSSLTPDEAPAEWLMETTSPGNLTRVGGWRRDIVKPGDEVEVVFHPLREPDKKMGLLRQLTTLANGEVFAANIRDQEKPGLE
jgi:Family of unknown function (DUF6152)